MAGPVIGRVAGMSNTPPCLPTYDVRHPAKTFLDIWSVNAAEEEQLRLDPRFFTGKAREISIFFSTDVKSSALRAIVQAYRSQDGTEENPRKAAFPRDRVPSYPELQRWAEEQIYCETSNDFKHLLQNFLLAYSSEGYGLPKVSVALDDPARQRLTEHSMISSPRSTR